MAAWNRWAVAVRAEGGGRLHPVGHVSLRGDLDWLDGELRALSAAGVRLAMISTGLVDGKRLSHPDLDRAWSLFEYHGVTPTFHVGGPSLVGLLDPGWVTNDDLDYMPMLSFPLHGTDAQLALCDLVSERRARTAPPPADRGGRAAARAGCPTWSSSSTPPTTRTAGSAATR